MSEDINRRHYLMGIGASAVVPVISGQTAAKPSMTNGKIPSEAIPHDLGVYNNGFESNQIRVELKESDSPATNTAHSRVYRLSGLNDQTRDQSEIISERHQFDIQSGKLYKVHVSTDTESATRTWYVPKNGKDFVSLTVAIRPSGEIDISNSIS